jgi:hypothetical protein
VVYATIVISSSPLDHLLNPVPQATCSLCPKGQYSELLLSNPVCTACSIGTFQDATGGTDCKNCASGLTTNADGSACVAGTRRLLRIDDDAAVWPVVKAFEALALDALTIAAQRGRPTVAETVPTEQTAHRFLGTNSTNTTSSPTAAPTAAPTMGSFSSHEDLCS